MDRVTLTGNVVLTRDQASMALARELQAIVDGMMGARCVRPPNWAQSQPAGESQTCELTRRRVIPNAVQRNTEHFGTEALKFGQEFVVERHLITTHRALISRAKHEDYWPPRKSCKETR